MSKEEMVKKLNELEEKMFMIMMVDADRWSNEDSRQYDAVVNEIIKLKKEM